MNDPLTVDDDPRLLARWHQPDEFRAGWTQCLSVIIPATLVRKPFSIDDADEPKGTVLWLPTLSRGYKCQLTVLLAGSASLDPEDVSQAGDAAIGSMRLSNGKVAWISCRRVKMSTEEQTYIEAFAKDMRINYEKTPQHVFAAVMSVERYTRHPLLTNFALGWDNVHTKK